MTQNLKKNYAKFKQENETELELYFFSIQNNTKIHFEFLRSIFEINLFIHFYPHGYAHGQSLRHILDKITKWHFHSTSNEVIWPKKISNFIHG